MENTGFWDKETKVGSLRKNAKGEEVVVKVVEKKGKQYVDLRTYYVNRAGELNPGKGIAIPMELAQDVFGLLSKALEAKKEVS